MLLFFAASPLARKTDLYFEIGGSIDLGFRSREAGDIMTKDQADLESEFETMRCCIVLTRAEGLYIRQKEVRSNIVIPAGG